MVVRAAWLPSRGTISIGESNEPFNPKLGAIRFASESPSEAAEEAEGDMNHEDAVEEQAVNPPKGSRGEDLSPEEIIKRGGDPMTTFLNIASLCNVAKVFYKEDEGWMARGDPTECAIQTFAHRFDWSREKWTEGDSPVWSKHILLVSPPKSILTRRILQPRSPSTPSTVT